LSCTVFDIAGIDVTDGAAAFAAFAAPDLNPFALLDSEASVN
jgi:hypothetical protein